MALPDSKAKPRASKQRDKQSVHIASEDQDVKGIIYAEMKINSSLYEDEDISAACAERLMMKVADATVSREHDPMRWGNSAGLTLLEMQEDMTRRIGALERTIASMQEKVCNFVGMLLFEEICC